MQARVYSGTWIRALAKYRCEGLEPMADAPRRADGCLGEIAVGDWFMKRGVAAPDGLEVWARSCAACSLVLVEREQHERRAVT